jgi:ABC-type multidrug transport system fused ATPase/permease subunit
MHSLRAIWSILTPRQRRAGGVLLVMLLIGMLLEVLGIGIVVPALRVVAGDPVAASPLAAGWLEWLGHPSEAQLILGGLLVLLGVYAIKAAYLLFASYWQARFVAALQSSLGRRLFETYLMQPWTFHLRHNSAKMIQQVAEVQGFASVCSLAIITLSELLVMGGIVTLLLCLEPLGTVVVAAVFIAAAGLFEWMTSGPTRRWGAARLEHATLALQQMRQGLGGLKDARVLGREPHFLHHFRSHADFVARMLARNLFVSALPRLWFELLTIVALCLVTAVLLWEGRPTRALIPTLGLFATAAFRMLPSINRMSCSFQQLSFSTAMIDRLRNELALGVPTPQDERAGPLAFRDQIVLESVSFAYEGRRQPAIDDVSIRIPHSASVGLIGGSGAGKSTLVDVILGLLPPTTGRVTVDGVDVRDNLRGWQRLIGYVAQSIYLGDDTIRRNVAFGLPDELIDDAAVRRAIAAARLDEFVAGLPQGLDTVVGERGVRLSGGQRQRIGIARALYHDPQVLVLDEATSSLDDATEKEVMAAVNSLHGTKTLIIVAHRLSTVADCDVLYRLDGGRIVQSGTFAEVVCP